MISLINLSKIFTDNFGNTSNVLKANAGDVVTYQFDISENIYFQTTATRRVTVHNDFQTSFKLFFPDFTSMNGFVVGQNVTLVVDTMPATGATAEILEIDYTNLSITLDDIGDIANPSGLNFSDTITLTIYSTDLRENLYLNLNDVNSSYAPLNNAIASSSEGGYISATATLRASSIDGTSTRLLVDTNGMVVTDVSNFVQQGFKSGAYAVECSIERLVDINSYTRQWRLLLTTTQTGVLNSDLFSGSGFINLYYDLEWFSIDDDASPTVVQWLLNPSNTGYFEQGFRTETPESELTTGITLPFYYNSASTHEIEITSSSSDIHLGACYKPKNELYYKNKYYNQANLGMQMLISPANLVVGIYTSQPNPIGASYTIEINSIAYALGVHTVNFTFTPNDEFKDLFEENGATDRELLIWFQVGNTNVLTFDAPLEKAPKEILPWDDLTPPAIPEFAIFQLDKTNHSYPATGPSLDGGAICSIEDNLLLRMYGNLSRTKTWLNSKFEVGILNTADSSDFTVLETYSFDWSDVIVDVNGVAQINKTVNIAENLPTTSGSRRQASLRYTGDDDTVSDFTVRFQCPLIINWRYWLSQLNAPVSFYPNQNKNYFNYFDAPYTIALRTTIENEDVIYQHDAPIDQIFDYDDAHNDTTEIWAGTTTCELFDENGNPVDNFIQGQIMGLLFTANGIIATTESQTWGQVTVEPSESSPRWMASTNYVNDTNQNNPFIPFLGQTKLLKSLQTPTVSQFQIQIDTNKINQGNNKFSFKFMNFASPKIEQVRSTFEFDFTSNLQNSDSSNSECCDVFKVFGIDENATHKNDFTSAFAIKPKGGDIIFRLYKDGVFVDTITGFTFPNQSNAKYGTIQWSSVLDALGAGCYEFRVVSVNSALTETEYVWGVYELEEWSQEGVKGLVQIRSYFNSNQTIEGIDFTGANVIDCINIDGFFGECDPKTVVDNVIYSTNLDDKVTNENINEYFFTSNPVTKLFSRKLLKLHFLSANDIYITDNNDFNHETYLLKRVILDVIEKPEYHEYTNKATIKATFTDKIKNERSYY